MFRNLSLALALMVALVPAVRADTVVVFAASSLKTALDEVAGEYQSTTGHRVAISYAGTSVLARQIALGAPADVFLSANSAWMDDLAARGVLQDHPRVDLMSNRLVVIAPEGAAPVQLGDLPRALGDGRLAMGLVDAVPVGIYGKAALSTRGLWDGLAPHVVQTDSARAALAMVARGEVAMGVVYATSAVAEPRVTVIATFPETSHPLIRYPVALLDDSAAARAFWDHLLSDDAAQVFARHGFLPAGAAP